jgi:hypothetical protein
MLPEVPGPVPVPESLRELSRLLLHMRAGFDKKHAGTGQPPATNRQIARLAYQSSVNSPYIPGRPSFPLPRVPADSHMTGVMKDWTVVESVADIKNLVIPGTALAFHIVRGLGGSHRDASAAYQLAEHARAERGEWRADEGADAAPQSSADDQLRAAVEAILAHLVPASKPGSRGKLPVAVELALARAILTFGTKDGKASLAWPLLDPDGFLAEPRIAAILARALTGGYLEGAPTLGQAWAGAFLDGSRVAELTTDAEDLLGYLWEQARELRPLTDLASARPAAEPGGPRMPTAAAPRTSAREPQPDVTARELRRRLSLARESIADFDRVAAGDIGRSARNLPPRLRFFLNDQTPLIASASRGFIGREWVLARVRAFIEGDADGYCFILTKPGVGKTALLAHLVADQPGYARHFNVLSEGVCTAEQFLNNVCAQLIGAYRLDSGLFPESGDANTNLLRRLLEQSAAKAREDKIVVVIDALDEALAGEPPKPGVNPLTLPRSLPERCRFIVTVRDGTPGWQPSLAADCAAVSLRIDAESAENMKDASAYVRSRLADPGIARYLRKRKLAAEEFTGEAANRSKGVFVYLKHVLDQLDAGGYLATQDLATLPVGLEPYYNDQYERMRADTPQRDWDDIRSPVLEQLAHAKHPMTAGELAARLGLRSVAPVRSAIQQWQQFLVETDGWWDGHLRPAHRLFHESFREFLIKYKFTV